MIRRVLKIGRWVVEFFFADDGYDDEEILDRLYDLDAPYSKMLRVKHIMEEGEFNRGFTYSNPAMRRALVVVGPTTSGEQFQNTFAHEIDHLSDQIAEYYGIKGRKEGTSYLTGDTTMALADVICSLGCSRCRCR